MCSALFVFFNSNVSKRGPAATQSSEPIAKDEHLDLLEELQKKITGELQELQSLGNAKVLHGCSGLIQAQAQRFDRRFTAIESDVTRLQAATADLEAKQKGMQETVGALKASMAAGDQRKNVAAALDSEGDRKSVV